MKIFGQSYPLHLLFYGISLFIFTSSCCYEIPTRRANRKLWDWVQNRNKLYHDTLRNLKTNSIHSQVRQTRHNIKSILFIAQHCSNIIILEIQSFGRSGNSLRLNMVEKCEGVQKIGFQFLASNWKYFLLFIKIKEILCIIIIRVWSLQSSFIYYVCVWVRGKTSIRLWLCFLFVF